MLSTLHLSGLSTSEIKRIHEATLETLESVGMYSYSDSILDVFSKGGAEVDSENRTVRIPQHLIDEAIRKAPKQIRLFGRNSKYDMILENKRTYFGLGGTPTPFILDVDSGTLRRPTKNDVCDATRLGDALPNISFVMTIAGAFDVPYETEYLHEFEALFNNTEKPIVYSAPGADITRRVFEMASAILGGMDELRKRPIVSIYSETASPLTFPIENDNMIECARFGVPITLGPAPLIGATGPGTLCGSAVVSNAESLAAITLAQLVNPGAPVIYACWADAMDPRTGRDCYAAPESALGCSVINTQMAEFYGLPNFGYAGCSDSKTPDAQAGAEVMMISLLNALAGVSLMHDCGYLAGGSVGSMEMAVICDEVLGTVTRILKGIEVTDDTLAVDIIKKVGPKGHFMSQIHTLHHIREIYMPDVFDRTDQETWVKAGGADVRKIARGKINRILNEHHPRPLDESVKAKLREVVIKAETELVGKKSNRSKS